MGKSAAQLSLFPELPEGARRRRPARVRAFFALWPDEPLREGLARTAALIPPGAARASRVRPERYHLTLSFLGMLEPAQIEAAQRAASQVRAASFRLVLDTVGHIAGPNVVWIGPGARCPPLAALKAELDRELLRYNLPVASSPFLPHITCLRGVREPPDPPPVHLDWPVREFVLVKSVLKPGNSYYKVIARWPLAP
ncbi:MAG: RNA 2',3'-cyclic phosphodiesterase [Sinobacteraceae bacterium]|nr:RNA 2',3'-cyclic phosphodiesterase [Nevskiaceae bacterium]